MIYLASPYSKYPGGKEKAFKLVVAKAAELMLEGYEVFCPIAHTHPIQNIIGDMDADWWIRQDFAVLQHCDELVIYTMPGWSESYGVGKELKFAIENRIPVRFIEFDGQDGVD